MQLVLQRTSSVNNTQFGELYLGDKFLCYTLEDKIRDTKIKHETCIPTGNYRIVITLSQRFKKKLPLLLNVPNFSGIRIHAGNTIADTSGCILVGSQIKNETLLHSASCLTKIMELISSGLKKESVCIEIKNPIIPEPVVLTPEPIELPVETISTSSTITNQKSLIQWIIHFLRNLLGKI